jgi:hypothetical protein
MFNSFLSIQNLFSLSGLVKISASWSMVPTFSIEMFPFYWWSLMKWWRTSMCFVLTCWIGLLVSFTALSLSHSNGTFLNLIPKSFNVAFIQRICHNNYRRLVSAACLPLSEHAYLAGLDLSPSLPRVVTGWGCALLNAVRLRQEEEVVADLGLSVRRGLLGPAGPRSFGPSLADVLRAAWPVTNRCLKTPCGYDPDRY